MTSIRNPRRTTSSVIAQLSDDLHPVRRLWQPRTRLLVWLGVQVSVLFAALLLFGVRGDSDTKLQQVPFAAELVALAAIAIMTALLALRAAVPGREPRVGITLGLLAVIVSLLAGRYAAEPSLSASTHEFIAMGWPCALRALAVAGIPWIAILVAIRRGATLVAVTAGVLGGAASFFFAALTLRLACSLDDNWHLIVWHLGPVVIGLTASAVLGRLWLARWRRAR